MCAHWGLVKFSPTRRSYSSCCISLPFFAMMFDCWEGWEFSNSVFSEDKVPLLMRRFFSVTSGTCGWKRLEHVFLTCVFLLIRNSRKIKYSVSHECNGGPESRDIKNRYYDSNSAGNNNPSLKSFHQKGQLRVSNSIPFWQLQLQSCLVWLGGLCTENKGWEQLYCMCESTWSPKVGNWKNISRFYSQNWAAGETATDAAKQTQQMRKPALWLVVISSTNTVSS